MRNILIVLSGPSGVGKGTIVSKLLEKTDIALSVSCTTRAPREGEIEGVHYYFITKEQFKEKIERGEVLEYNEHFGNFYGTPLDFVEKQLSHHDVLLEIEVDGGMKVKKKRPDTILIMVAPPSLKELKARLVGRGTEATENIDLRLERVEYELSKSRYYDYVVINDEIDRAVDEIIEIIKKEKEK